MEENYRELCVALFIFFFFFSAGLKMNSTICCLSRAKQRYEQSLFLSDDPLLITYFWIISDHKLQLTLLLKEITWYYVFRVNKILLHVPEPYDAERQWLNTAAESQRLLHLVVLLQELMKHFLKQIIV